MATKMGTKKRLLVLVLAAAMAVSVLAGGLFFIDANAATDLAVNSADLFTVSEGVTKLSASKYVTGENTEVGDTGLRFQSQNDEAFTIELNGVFHRSFGLEWSAPADGWVSGGADVVFEIAEFGNPENKFEIHYGGEWQSNAWVEYDYTDSAGTTQTLYRSYGFNHGGHSRMLYSKDIIVDALYSNPDGSDIRFRPVLTDKEVNAKARTTISVYDPTHQDGDPVALPTDSEEAVIDVSGYCVGGDGYVNIASFRDDPETFEPTTEQTEEYAKTFWDPSSKENADYNIGYNLPRINFENGYTVTIHVSKGLEFMVYSLGEVFEVEDNNYWTADPWNAGYPCMQIGTTAEKAQRTSALDDNMSAKYPVSDFYQNWQNESVIAIEGYRYLNDSYIGQEVTLPQASVLHQGQEQAFTGTITVTDGSGTPQTASGGKYTIARKGTHTVTYTQDTLTKSFTFSAGEAVYAVSDAVDVDNGQLSLEADAKGNKGINVKGAQSNAYAGAFAGSFAGNAVIEFTFPDAVNGEAAGGQFAYVIRDAEGAEIFRIVYNAAGWRTNVYVKYGDEIRSYGKSCNIGTNWSGEAYFYRAPQNEEFFAQPCLNNYSGSQKAGTLRLWWEGDVFCVGADNRDGELLTIAKFDGSQKPSQAQIGSDGYILVKDQGAATAEAEKAAWGLPNIADRLAEGYTIGFEYDGTRTNSVTFLSVNGIAFGEKANLVTDYVFSVSMQPEKAYVSGSNIYVAEGFDVGSMRLLYAYAFTGAAAGYEGSWSLSHQVFDKPFESYYTDKSVGTQTVTIASTDAGEKWNGLDKQFTLHIEEAWELSFNTEGGTVLEGSSPDPITFSDHTRFLLSVPEVEKIFWQFDGWGIGSAEQGAKWNGSFAVFSGDTTLHALWIDVTPPTVALTDGVESYTEVLLEDGSFTISKEDVIASDAAQPENATLEIKYRREGESDYTVLSGDSQEITVTAAGTWEIVYTVSDGVNDPVTLTRTVTVVDRAAPEVKIGTPVTESYVGFAVSVAGVTAQDADGKTLPVTVTVTDAAGNAYAVTNGAFTPDKAGVYTVSCTAEDGSKIGYASYKVTVVYDTEAPELKVDFADKTVDRGEKVILPEASVTDNAYSDVTVTVKVAFGTKVVTISGGAFIASEAGVYTITWTAEDGAGNTSSVSAQVTVMPAGASNIWLYVGIAAGVLVAAAVAVAIAVPLARRKKRKKEQQNGQPPYDENNQPPYDGGDQPPYDANNQPPYGQNGQN